ncbi:N-acetylmuramoyl-L-alanine amidase CwlL [Planktothrix tepida]|uniref:Endopeptidase, cell wall lytic activity n=2 Tax=Planktothrix TaxID=54304 RepID=A0A1J1LDN1_9CYAN|nr:MULTISPECIES: peptidoglycan-binding protein [Planktothrix]CAD5917114.1 N-acetylmuramoyl-L-alanine amidase CwlL [Planktothrix tepida]CAD5985305.1 N-acetylmuramoyl-L-alanine amidase CwlL [Planktothrix pseudagardhii]CUR30709.1 Endopeptidase, cell wall lytic activity [Planktothrix tepida PCC 9214]
MDTLAYNHLVSAYESPRQPHVNGGLVLFRGVNWSQLSTACWMPIVAAAIGLSVVSVSQPASAALYYGDSGYSVKKVQYALQDYGYFTGKATGYFGKVTKHAVMAFQRDYGLYPDGVVGSATASALGVGSGYHEPKHSYSNASYGGCGHCGGSSSYLSRGDSSYHVKQLQNRLADLGYFNANSTGYYGKLTAHAVKAFQENCGLSADGIAGPATLAALGL